MSKKENKEENKGKGGSASKYVNKSSRKSADNSNINEKHGIDVNNKQEYDEFIGEAIKYFPRLYSAALYLTHDKDNAQDLVQDTYKKALTSAHLFRKGTNLSAWLQTILRNTYINEYNRNKKIKLSKSATDDDISDYQMYRAGLLNGVTEQETEQEVFDRIPNKLIKTALDEMDEKKRSILYYVDVEQFSYQDVADMLDIPIGTVMSRLHRARSEFKNKLKKLYVQHVDKNKDVSEVTLSDVENYQENAAGIDKQ